MLARKYSTKVGIYVQQMIPDGFGGLLPEEVLVKSVWAEVKTSAGYKFQAAGIADFKGPVTFSVRGKKNGIAFTENHFVKYNGKNLFVKSVEDANLEGMEYVLYCDLK